MKLYRTRTQEQYDWLMQKLEDEGCFWASGKKPTELDYSKQHDVVSVGRFMAKEIWREKFKGATDEPIIEVADLMTDHLANKVIERNNKPETLNTGDPWIDNLPESYFEMYEEESKTDKYARHKEITDYMHKTYVSKNKDYGNSFERTHKEIGERASLGRIADKFYRLQNIILNDKQLVEDETVKDTLIDMANYAIMFAMELEEEDGN